VTGVVKQQSVDSKRDRLRPSSLMRPNLHYNEMTILKT
jgi:hypothetical protein